MGFWRGLTRGRIREDRGAYAVLFAITLIAIFAMVAIVVDLGAQKSDVRHNREYADLAALSGAINLPNGQGACNTAWSYLVLNGAVPVGTASPCAGLPTTCDINNPVPVSVTETVGNTVYTFTFPVLDSYLASLSPSSLGTGTRTQDQKPCDRMAVDVRSRSASFFSGIFGPGGLSAPGTAVVVRSPGVHKVPVALLLLEPHGCEVLTTGGNNVQVYVHAAPSDSALGFDPNGGRITADSNAHPVSGDNSCNGSNTVIDVNGSDPDRILAYNTLDPSLPVSDQNFRPVLPGVIEVYAIQPPDSTCTALNLACKLAQINPPGTAMVDAQTAAGGYGVPNSLVQRITRAPFDNRFNCTQTGLYPNYLGLADDPVLLDTNVCTPGVTHAYINELVSQIDGAVSNATGPPVTNSGSWTVLGPGGGACTQTGNPTFTGNYYVNCPNFDVKSGTTNFKNGNVVFQGSVSVEGTLNINVTTAVGDKSPAWNTNNCLTNVVGCSDQWNQQAVFVYQRPGGSNAGCGGSGSSQFCVGGTANLNNVLLFQRDPTVFGAPTSCGTYPGNDSCTSDDSVFAVKTGSALTINTAPVIGPFANLAIWNESSLTQTLQGQGGANLTGVFFFPTAQVNYSGQGCSLPTNAQFVARRLNVVGNGCLNMRPTPGRTVNINEFGPLLIR